MEFDDQAALLCSIPRPIRVTRRRSMVPRRRLELPRGLPHRYLKPARLPIPPPGHWRSGKSLNDAILVNRLLRWFYPRPAEAAAGNPLVLRRPEGGDRDSMALRLVTVFGGAGFIGRQGVQRRAKIRAQEIGR